MSSDNANSWVGKHGYTWKEEQITKKLECIFNYPGSDHRAQVQRVLQVPWLQLMIAETSFKKSTFTLTICKSTSQFIFIFLNTSCRKTHHRKFLSKNEAVIKHFIYKIIQGNSLKHKSSFTKRGCLMSLKKLPLNDHAFRQRRFFPWKKERNFFHEIPLYLTLMTLIKEDISKHNAGSGLLPGMCQGQRPSQSKEVSQTQYV